MLYAKNAACRLEEYQDMAIADAHILLKKICGRLVAVSNSPYQIDSSEDKLKLDAYTRVCKQLWKIWNTLRIHPEFMQDDSVIKAFIQFTEASVFLWKQTINPLLLISLCNYLDFIINDEAVIGHCAKVIYEYCDVSSEAKKQALETIGNRTRKSAPYPFTVKLKYLLRTVS